MIILSILFFITAILYSSVGFGGGSTYLALLLIWDIPYYIFPVIALLCNIIVVSGNSFNYIRAGNHNFKLDVRIYDRSILKQKYCNLSVLKQYKLLSIHVTHRETLYDLIINTMLDNHTSNGRIRCLYKLVSV